MTSVWQSQAAHLPIFNHLSSITSVLSERHTLVLQAAPGTGKTTVLPIHLLSAPWLKDLKILVLQPRRLAAKSVATRMSQMLGEELGRTVGYQMRLDRVISSATRIELITEGILTRKILSDPALEGVGMIIFDEFHERGIHADIGLALAREVQETLRPDLRILIMSATLAEPTSLNGFTDVARYEFSGTPHPVKIHYAPADPRLPLWERVAGCVSSAFAQHPEGDVLVFLPGSYEIQRTEGLLLERGIKAVIHSLYGDLPPQEQDRALLPDPAGRRKVVLSTPVAETSLTIEGVRIIVDSGLHKVSRTEAPGSTTLRTERISRDSSDQRAGRAGRTAPGVCYRLWSEQEHLALRPFREPEVLRVDLAGCVLDLAAWGVRASADFDWLTPPPRAAFDAAQSLLREIGALEDDNSLTAEGKTLSQLGAHPLLGRLAVVARQNGLETLASRVLALMEERDLMGSKSDTVDIQSRLALLGSKGSRSSRLRRVEMLAERWYRRITSLPRSSSTTRATDLDETNQLGFLFAQAFPFHIAKRRAPGKPRYLLASGKGCSLPEKDPLVQHEYIVALTLRGGDTDYLVSLASPLHPQLVHGPLSNLVREELIVEFNTERGALNSFLRGSLGALVVYQRAKGNLDPNDEKEALLSYMATEEGFARLPFSEVATKLRARIVFVRQAGSTEPLPDLSPATLRESISTWLEPFLTEPYRLTRITASLLDSALQALVSFSAQKELNRVAPSSIMLPCGKSRSITYTDDGQGILEATIQELFGLKESPRLGRSQLPLTIHLLSPARRVVQVTQDLAHFWRSGYREVRKELRGRYPKHAWPQDPFDAVQKR